MCDIVNHLVSTSTSYIRLRSHIVELDFLGNLELKPKPEVQEAHILVNNLLYTVLLFCEEKRSWWNKLLSNFPLWSIVSKLENKKRNHYVDSSPTQYKNKYALYLLQSLANTCNIRIIRIYGSAVHGKGIVDAVSSYGVKSILHRNIITHEQCFQSSSEICDYLQFHGGKRKCYININVNAVGFKTINKNEAPIKNSIMQHFFDYKPSSEKVFIRKYLRDCEQRLNFNFIFNA